MVAAELATLQNGSNRYTNAGELINSPTLTIEQVADAVGVGRDTVVRAKAVKRDAAPKSFKR
jgi:hypothetical protein